MNTQLSKKINVLRLYIGGIGAIFAFPCPTPVRCRYAKQARELGPPIARIKVHKSSYADSPTAGPQTHR